MGCRNGAQGRGHSPSPTPPKTREGRARWAWTGGLARSAAGSLGPGPCSSARPSSRSTRPRAASLPGGPSRILSVKRTAAVCRDKLHLHKQKTTVCYPLSQYQLCAFHPSFKRLQGEEGSRRSGTLAYNTFSFLMA